MEITGHKDMRARVEHLEAALEKVPQVECGLRNHFAPGIYMREMTVPAGVIATGAVHKTEHMTIVFGHCHLTTDDGVQELKGYHVVKSRAGAKRAIAAIEETIVTTIHPTTETDLDKLCEELTETTSAELIGGPMNRQLLAQQQNALEN